MSSRRHNNKIDKLAEIIINVLIVRGQKYLKSHGMAHDIGKNLETLYKTQHPQQPEWFTEFIDSVTSNRQYHNCLTKAFISQIYRDFAEICGECKTVEQMFESFMVRMIPDIAYDYLNPINGKTNAYISALLYEILPQSRNVPSPRMSKTEKLASYMLGERAKQSNVLSHIHKDPQIHTPNITQPSTVRYWQKDLYALMRDISAREAINYVCFLPKSTEIAIDFNKCQKPPKITVSDNLSAQLLTCTGKIAVINLILCGFRETADNVVMSHSNMLIINTATKEYERFEPHGHFNLDRNLRCGNTMHEQVDELIRKKFAQILPNYAYVEPLAYCPYERAPQNVNRATHPKHCVYYSTLYAHLRILNPTYSRETVVNNVNALFATPGYVKQYEAYLSQFDV